MLKGFKYITYFHVDQLWIFDYIFGIIYLVLKSKYLWLKNKIISTIKTIIFKQYFV